MSAAPAAVHRPALVDVDDGVDLIEYCYEQGWTDGLPVVPPTPGKVAAAIAATGRSPDEVVCHYVERQRDVTIEHVAVNAVMAGCRPEYTPVVVAIVEAIGADDGLHALNATTGGSALGFVVNGPVRTALGMNWRGNVFGPGNRANSTIGRAVRLVQINALGSVPGAGNESASDARPVLDRATMGQPAKYAAYHIVENEEDFPSLAPLHVERGFAPDQSVVTVFGTGGHVQWSVHHEATAEEVIGTLAHYMVHSGQLRRAGFCVVVLPPETAEVFVRDGWAKADIRQALFDGTTRSVAWAKRNGWTLTGGLMDRRGGAVAPADEDARVAIAGSPEDVLVAVAGGPAGAFVHALFPYAGGVVSREVQMPKEGA
ncbi:MAG TPA: hypothetical protein VMU14_09595 [Acidimicrobiales bacterium]|nr:hypothetical protein [Acidimicrobiales bacterium]